MDVCDVPPSTSRVSSSTQTIVISKSDKANTTLQEYAKILKPVLSASSRLGRALAELFGLLVKVRELADQDRESTLTYLT